MEKDIKTKHILKSGLATAQKVSSHILGFSALVLLLSLPFFSPEYFGTPSYLTLSIFVIAWITMRLFIRKAAFAVINSQKVNSEVSQPGSFLLGWRTAGAIVLLCLLGFVIYLALSTIIGLPVLISFRASYSTLFFIGALLLCTPIILGYLVLIELSCTSIVAGNQVGAAISEAALRIRKNFQLLIKVALLCFSTFYGSLYLIVLMMVSSGFEDQAGQITIPEFVFLPSIGFAMGSAVQVIFVYAYQELRS